MVAVTAAAADAAPLLSCQKFKNLINLKSFAAAAVAAAEMYCSAALRLIVG